jgi:hypothetical protein
MQLRIETFNNSRGGNSFFKAVTHPLAARRAPDLLRRLAAAPLAVYDPEGRIEGLAEIYGLAALPVAGCYVQDFAAVGQPLLGRPAEPVVALRSSGATTVFIAAFDASRAADHIRHLLPPGAAVVTLDALRLPDTLLTNPQRYLDPLNFATNFVFFRDAGGHATRLVSANYWAGYGGAARKLWLLLLGENGETLAEWEEPLPAGQAAIVIDSGAVRRRFALPDFTGQLFLHAIGAAGHDVVKYALDTVTADGDHGLSCTHDANSWPAAYYAGLPAPDRDERVILWVQNSLPCPIPAGTVGLGEMGHAAVRTIARPIAPFATYALDVGTLLPELRWPRQIEVSAGKYMVRPRYEILHGTHRRIAHVNVERDDLRPDPTIPKLGALFGKGYLLPAPILPRRRWQSVALPTPMARTQRELPLAIVCYDPAGRELARRDFGRLGRGDLPLIDLDALLDGRDFDYGHLELTYDFHDGGEADGWLHGLFRYTERASRHAAETSFGAHIFNTALVYRDEPQSYAARPPGLSTRLFLRLGRAPYDTLCHLIYPASTPWHATSRTELILSDSAGREVARKTIAIPCSGSRLWRYHEMFEPDERARAGADPYVIVRDATCRLFGYHGLLGAGGAFSLDHMFGF